MSNVDFERAERPKWAQRVLAAEFEALPRIGVVQSARRYWHIVLVPVVIFVAVAAVAASRRTPHYSAEARLMVGRLNISSPGAITGFTQAAQDLASAYPLVINADGVIDPLASRFHTSPADIRKRLSATQVPSSPIIRVMATGSSAQGAQNLANAASASLVAYLTKFNMDDPDATRLLAAVNAAEVAYQKAQAAYAGHPRPALTPADQRLAAAVDTALLQVKSLSTDYSLTLETEAVTSLLQPLVSASSATSDRTSVLEIALFAALVGGTVVGLALATIRANRTARRALATPSWEPELGGSSHSEEPAAIE
jgi:capsular polysaccharide biosynthesis protein